MQETRVTSLGWEDSLEEEIATQSSILAWRILWTEEPGGLQSVGSLRIRHDRTTNFHFSFNSSFILGTLKCMGFPCGPAGKESACNERHLGSIPGSGRFPGEGKGYPLQYSGLENPMDCRVHGVAKSQTRPSDFHSLTLSVCRKFYSTLVENPVRQD